MNSTPSTSAVEAAAAPTVTVDHFYRLSQETTSPMATIDRLADVLAHLHAQLVMITGNGHENFAEYSDAIQASYLYGCSKQAQEAVDLLRVVAPAVCRTAH